jgi:N-acetylglucosamine malate deacetylase 2
MKILVVLAHPDDEAFGPGGTLARYAVTGHPVRLITMTHGEAGTLGPAKHLTRQELARVRSAELRCSAAALHLAGLEIYHLSDGKLAELPDEEGLAIIRREIDSFAPDALITFHSEGISHHPDHQTVARWCSLAVKERSEPLRLFAFGISVQQARRVTQRKLTPIPEDEVTHVVDVSRYLDHKFAAIGCHKSQAEGWQRIQQVEGGLMSFLQKEHFSQVWPARAEKDIADRLED